MKHNEMDWVETIFKDWAGSQPMEIDRDHTHTHMMVQLSHQNTRTIWGNQPTKHTPGANSEGHKFYLRIPIRKVGAFSDSGKLQLVQTDPQGTETMHTHTFTREIGNRLELSEIEKRLSDSVRR